jgi:hypothetical protein
LFGLGGASGDGAGRVAATAWGGQSGWALQGSGGVVVLGR